MVETDPQPTIDPARISARAHELYVRRGKVAGRALDDWLEAERQLREEARAKALSPKAPPTAPPNAIASPPAAPVAPAAPGKGKKAGGGKSAKKRR
jgi:hypothetical protein